MCPKARIVVFLPQFSLIFIVCVHVFICGVLSVTFVAFLKSRIKMHYPHHTIDTIMTNHGVLVKSVEGTSLPRWPWISPKKDERSVKHLGEALEQRGISHGTESGWSSMKDLKAQATYCAIHPAQHGQGESRQELDKIQVVQIWPSYSSTLSTFASFRETSLLGDLTAKDQHQGSPRWT